jgi:hypothetical protein
MATILAGVNYQKNYFKTPHKCQTSMENKINEKELSTKEKIMEVMAVGMCFLLLLASFLKVMFF